MLSRSLNFLKDDAGRTILLQILRFGLVGVSVTLLQIAIYDAAVELVGMDPQVANAVASGIVLVIAYVAHSRFTFRGHGVRDNVARTGGRFVAVHFAGWLANTFWIWLLVSIAELPAWAPTIPMLFVTSVMMFALKRWWVFR
jgi:putative flippase GtrA